MSLRTHKDNIFFILPEDRYSISKKVDTYMSNDFTLFIKAKINKEGLENEKNHFLFSRNGQHSGITIFKNKLNQLFCTFGWWIEDEISGKSYYDEIPFQINEAIEEDENEYTMICDNAEKTIKCYFNGAEMGIIDYKNKKLKSYEKAFYWFGCGSMIVDDEHRYIGDFDFHLAFLLDKALEISVADNLANHYENFTHDMHNGLRRINDDFYLKDNFAFFCDFKKKTRYKAWDMTFSGNYPQVYMENNIYF
jgi:hypothetical protein